jgi:hypothetical protein
LDGVPKMYVGEMVVPSFRLRILIPQLKNVYQMYGGKEFSREQLAQAMALNQNSGGFSQKVSDLQNYNLMTKNITGNYSLTELCQKIFQTSDKTLSSAFLQEAFANVDLWKAIFIKYNDSINPTTFTKDLVELTGLDEPTAHKRTDEIIKEYMKDRGFIKNPSLDIVRQRNPSIIHMKKKSEPQSTNNMNEFRFKGVKTPSYIKWELRLNSEVGNIQLDIFDPDSYKRACNVLQSIIGSQFATEPQRGEPQMGN